MSSWRQSVRRSILCKWLCLEIPIIFFIMTLVEKRQFNVFSTSFLSSLMFLLLIHHSTQFTPLFLSSLPSRCLSLLILSSQCVNRADFFLTVFVPFSITKSSPRPLVRLWSWFPRRFNSVSYFGLSSIYLSWLYNGRRTCVSTMFHGFVYQGNGTIMTAHNVIIPCVMTLWNLHCHLCYGLLSLFPFGGTYNFYCYFQTWQMTLQNLHRSLQLTSCYSKTRRFIAVFLVQLPRKKEGLSCRRFQVTDSWPIVRKSSLHSPILGFFKFFFHFHFFALYLHFLFW